MPLTVENLQKSYAGRPVVRGVSFSVNVGEVVGLLGPNGAGKTTSFYAVVGIIQPDGGDVRLDEQSIRRLPIHARARAGIGYLPQETSVFRKLTVEENLALVLEFQPLNRRQRQQRIDALLEEFGIARLRKKPAIQLSGGERRRVEIARALASEPTYLLLDEPFTGIDPITIQELQVLITHLKQRGLGILMTDHNPKATLSIVDRAYIIHDGQLIFSGTNTEVATNELVRQSYLGEDFQL
ncbi:MAG: LPS export ABC transporter ATP-binding protein [Candidatus Melainabacteria bacterium]|nr:LPS export ABC transporter ATP-binding protein [Candidatus Melainabacteria bacterium]